MLPLVAVLRNTETVAERLFAVAKSGLPSPSKSPMATEKGPDPVVKSTLAAKLIGTLLPLFDVLRKTETLLETPFATANSSLPSPSKSPRATEVGYEFTAVAKSTLGAKLPVLMLPLLDILRSTETVNEL